MEIVIVGGSFAGVTAALTAREKFPTAMITLIDKKAELGFIPGALNLLLNDKMKALHQAFFISLAQLEKAQINILLKSEVIGLDVKGHHVNLRQGEKHQTLSYTKLIIASGSSQHSTKINGIQTDKIVTYKSFSETEAALQLIHASHSFTIIGGGQVGVEMADSLIRIGKKVQLVESMDHILAKYFDPEMVELVVAEMRQRGVELYFEQSVQDIKERETELEITTQKQVLVSDSAVYAINVKPNLSYLKGAVKCHPDQTILVDEYLQTSAPDVFAIGDCIQMPSSLANESFYVPLVNNAVRTALVAVENLSLPRQTFVGSVRTLGAKVFDYYLASTGLTETESIFFDEEIAVQHVTQKTFWDPSRSEIRGKLIYNRLTGKILGAQLISQENILEKINTLALGIQMGLTVTELANKDYFFHPAWTNIYDITNQLGLMKD